MKGLNMVSVKQVITFLEDYDDGYVIDIDVIDGHAVLFVENGSDPVPSLCITHGPRCDA